MNIEALLFRVTFEFHIGSASPPEKYHTHEPLGGLKAAKDDNSYSPTNKGDAELNKYFQQSQK